MSLAHGAEGCLLAAHRPSARLVALLHRAVGLVRGRASQLEATTNERK